MSNDVTDLSLPKKLLVECITAFHRHFQQHVFSIIAQHFQGLPLPELQSVLDRTATINEKIARMAGTLVRTLDVFERNSINQDRLLKQIVLAHRRQIAVQTETQRQRTINIALIASVEDNLRVLDELTRQKWFQSIERERLPRVSDYLPTEFITTGRLTTNLPEQFDEKFHILQAPGQFLQHLVALRADCESRERPVTVAFLDIDDFKQFNTKYGETKVDRNLLPRFMQVIESSIARHGYGYRQGGDEYLIILPTLSQPLVFALLDELRNSIATAQYLEIEERTTVSIGVCVAEPGSPFTDRELRERANQAKDFAKRHGKNCLATFSEPDGGSDTLRLVRPKLELIMQPIMD